MIKEIFYNLNFNKPMISKVLSLNWSDFEEFQPPLIHLLTEEACDDDDDDECVV